MDKRLTEVLTGQEDNYLLPFFWQHDGNRVNLRAQVRQVRASGARALCVESRPHEHFCEEEWWGDMEEILDEARALDMKVWILDDKHFPTGYANGLISKKYPERRKWQLIEHHVDVMGPMSGSSLLAPELSAEDELIGIVAYPRAEWEEVLVNRPVDLTSALKGRFLYWDIPEGCWRVFFFIKTRKHLSEHAMDYIHLIDADSVKVQIEAVYEPHFEKLGRYFGNTIAGFFSDEPSLGNTYFNRSVPNNGMYDMRIGMPGVALPWSDELYARIKGRLGEDAVRSFGALWYPLGDCAPEVRYEYMDSVTRLYRDHFCRQLGSWCRAHGVLYIGHIIEDNNAHARLGCSGGHYFRSLDGQDMSGIDIVLHQVMPGMAQYKTSAIAATGVVDSEFFHYVLAKLGSSMAHINPQTKGRAMCEVFGAYGWAEGAPMMKWLMDHLIVRGITHFVPHAFSPAFPDPDCPPHFGAAGKDPQFDGFTQLMGYVNRASHLLSGGRYVADVAILYHAEAEWMNGTDCMLTQKPAKALYDRHIDYDIVPMDALVEDARVADAALMIHEARYRCLIVPYAPRLPKALIATLNRLQREGLRILYVDGAPHGVHAPDIVALGALVQTLIDEEIPRIHVDGEYPLLRINHIERDGNAYFMLFNESIADWVETTVQFPTRGACVALDLLNQAQWAADAKEQRVRVSLAPYESVIYAFGDLTPIETPRHAPRAIREEALAAVYDIECCATDRYPAFEAYRQNAPLINLTGPDAMPDFSGIARYTTTVIIDGALPDAIDLGVVGQTARLHVNGADLGQRICPPYRFDVRGHLMQKENVIEIEVANTLVHEVKDVFSMYLQISPSGLIGPVKLIYREEA